MKFRLPSPVLTFALGCSGSACGQTSADPVELPQVQVTGTVSDADARRDFVAGKIIIGRKRIEESGVRKVDELLRREPAVTVGSDGRIGLLNMPGYTQVLIDGKEPIGRSAQDLDVALVEKIEIIKSSMAEYGPFGIAGTINIISRKTSRKTETELSASVARSGGKAEGVFSLSHNQRVAGLPLAYRFGLAADSGAYASQALTSNTVIRPGQTEREMWHGSRRSQWRRPSVSGSAEIEWKPADGGTVRISPQLTKARSSGRQDETRFSQGRASNAYLKSGTAMDSASLPIRWLFNPSSKSHIEVSAGAVLVRIEESQDWIDDGFGMPRMVRKDFICNDGQSQSLDLAYRASLGAGHEFKFGSSARRLAFVKDFGHRDDELRSRVLDVLGERRNSVERYLRLFVQDEWRLSEKTAVNAGVSGQRTLITVGENLYRGRTRFQLWSPSLHISRKVGTDDSRQLRVEMARSFKAPEADAYTTHPQINALKPCPPSALCGPNTVETSDGAGNLGLRPERSLSFNASYEHGLGDASQFSFEIFKRRIENKIGKEIGLENVPWAVVPRYVSRPVNLGSASTSGLNLEMNLAARDIVASAPNVVIRGSALLARSHVLTIPGPDNRLDKQPPWSVKLGGTYKKVGWPVVLDIDASWKPSVWTRTSRSERTFVARDAGLDASLRWNLTRGGRVVFSWKTMTPATADTITEYVNIEEKVRLYTRMRRFSTVRLQVEAPL